MEFTVETGDDRLRDVRPWNGTGSKQALKYVARAQRRAPFTEEREFDERVEMPRKSERAADADMVLEVVAAVPGHRPARAATEVARHDERCHEAAKGLADRDA